MKKYTILLPVFIFLFVACKNNTDTASGNSITTEEQNSTAHNHKDHTDHLAAMTLNNGQKWDANVETTEAIARMRTLVETSPEQGSADDYHSLQIKLENEFKTIFEKCTMTGEAHNQLHNYLVPIKEMMEKFDSNSEEELREVKENLKHHLKEYTSYFQ